jgi:hypothetical protein
MAGEGDRRDHEWPCGAGARYRCRLVRRPDVNVGPRRGRRANAQLKDCRIVRQNMPTPAAPDEGMPPTVQPFTHLA